MTIDISNHDKAKIEGKRRAKNKKFADKQKTKIKKTSDPIQVVEKEVSFKEKYPEPKGGGGLRKARIPKVTKK